MRCWGVGSARSRPAAAQRSDLPARAAGLILPAVRARVRIPPALGALLAATAIAALSRADPPADDEIRALLQARLERTGAAGALVAALLDGEQTRFIAVGRSGNPMRPQADEHTLFQIASVTKTF